MLDVFQIRCKILPKKELLWEVLQQALIQFMDSSLFFDESIGELHHQRRFKFYCFDQLYPMESNKIYQVGKPYTLTIRTIKKDLAIYFDRVLSHHESALLQGKSTEIRTVPYRPIDRLYSITPVVLKNDKGYWRDWMTLSEYENQLFINLVKKYNESTGKKLDENFTWTNSITFSNRKPIAVKQKNIILLGDKLELKISEHSSAQILAHFALGVGLGGNNARGSGFVNVKWK